ncbi:SUMF1/EgtB/PvdO family nonheme iron enzyme [Thalassotalea aquiviva]|uniref:SUMF1/EgtB/PvdO family nonheme iron enzyme n=1 Tax=Thalassotalea aquiviva TaxID=3242415 RepID=UPI00352A9487
MSDNNNVIVIGSQSETDSDQTKASTTITAANYVPASKRKPKKVKKVSPWLYIILAIVVIGAVPLWYVFSAKSVVLKLAPQTETFSVSGGFFVTLADRMLMLPGQYQVKASLPGYHQIDQPFLVNDKQNQAIDLTFTPLPGDIVLQTQHGKELTVNIDGEPVAITNNRIIDVPAGERKFIFNATNYFEQVINVEVFGQGREQQLEVNLTPAWAQIDFASEPEGVSVYEQDKLLGQTPFSTNVLQGERIFKFEKLGFQSSERIVNVTAGQPQTIENIRLFKQLGTLKVNTKPQGVSVTLGDQYLGTTPLTVNVAPDKQQPLLLFKDGYGSKSSSLMVPSGETVSRFFELSPNVAKVTFKVEPSDALLYVNGRLMGRANQQIAMTSKQQSVRIEKPGYVSYEKTFLPNASAAQLINVRLQTIEEHRWANIKPFISTEFGTRLKLFKPNDTIIMGASRREQGRRANEITRTVQVTRPFYLGVKEISNKEFRQFFKQHSSGHFKSHSLNGVNQPAVQLSWLQAVQYCNWLSSREQLQPVYNIVDDKVVSFNFDHNGYRLPTEAEWVWASRYINGQMLKYPWGNALPPKAKAGNFADVSSASILGTILPNYNDGYIASAPVGVFGQNPKGIYDLAGNVAEWIHDYYQINSGLSMKTEKDPVGPLKGDYHVIKGSSWAHGSRTELRLSFRDYGNDKRHDVGFRVARNAM